MLSKCANPSCSNRFLRLREGKLFRWDGLGIVHNPQSGVIAQGKPSGKIEYFWLCASCSSRVTVVFRQGGGITVRPIIRVQKAS